MDETKQEVPVPPEAQVRKICPILSVGTIRPTQSNLVVGPTGLAPQASGGALEFVPCVQGNCEMWVDIHDDQGKSIGGKCAIALFPNAANSIATTILGIARGGSPGHAARGNGATAPVNPIRRR